MDKCTQLQAERDFVEGQLVAIERAIHELVPGTDDAERKAGYLATSLKNHLVRLHLVNARLSELGGSAAAR